MEVLVVVMALLFSTDDMTRSCGIGVGSAGGGDDVVFDRDEMMRNPAKGGTLLRGTQQRLLQEQAVAVITWWRGSVNTTIYR